ncbi:unnamed protein product [Durusdinium trenchii]|uniref:EF-hand domain-containing protein n=1 Tax=Durusdinium trenchii TaxID=1381693 RepID=A0ABP0RCS5_9DINO
MNDAAIEQTTAAVNLAVQRLHMYKEDADIAAQVLKPASKKRAKKGKKAKDLENEEDDDATGLIPMSLYADEVATYKGTEVEMQRVTEQGPKFRPVLEIGGAATDSRSPKMVVITFYNGQASLIRQLMGDVSIPVHTVDSFQGSEADIVLLSFVRANDQGRLGFLQEFRRLNVALTRAKRSLIVFANCRALDAKSTSQTCDVGALLADAQKRGRVWEENQATETFFGPTTRRDAKKSRRSTLKKRPRTPSPRDDVRPTKKLRKRRLDVPTAPRSRAERAEPVKLPDADGDRGEKISAAAPERPGRAAREKSPYREAVEIAAVARSRSPTPPPGLREVEGPLLDGLPGVLLRMKGLDSLTKLLGMLESTICEPAQRSTRVYANEGTMSFEQFQLMCEDKGFGDLEEEEVAAAFVRMSGAKIGIDYTTFLDWRKTQDDRQSGLRFRSEEEKEMVHRAKKSFFAGTGGCTRMTKEDFQLKCYFAGYCLSQEELEEAFRELDKDGSGYIDFPEYLRWRQGDNRFAHLFHDASDEHSEYIRQVGDFFRAYDEELKGQLSVEQFRPLYESLVEQGEVSECFENVIQQVDTNGDGQVSLNEFIKWYAETWETNEDSDAEA